MYTLILSIHFKKWKSISQDIINKKITTNKSQSNKRYCAIDIFFLIRYEYKSVDLNPYHVMYSRFYRTYSTGSPVEIC